MCIIVCIRQHGKPSEGARRGAVVRRMEHGQAGTRLTVQTFKNLTELVGLAGLGDCLSVADTSPSVLSEISGSKTLALGETAPKASFSPSATLLARGLPCGHSKIWANWWAWRVWVTA